MRVLVSAVVVAVGLVASPLPAPGQAVAPQDGVLSIILPLTPEQASEVVALLASRSLGADLADAGQAVLDAVPALPRALVHDVVTAPARHLHMLQAVVTDLTDVGAWMSGRLTGVFRRTLRAVHESATLSAAAGAARRMIAPTNRTVRLAVVLMVRAQGIPLEVADLDAVRQAIDRDAPDLAPLVDRVLDRLVRAYGRDAIRVTLTP